MNKLYENKLQVLISHKKMSIINSKKILVIKNGKIVEEGKLNDLEYYF